MCKYYTSYYLLKAYKTLVLLLIHRRTFMKVCVMKVFRYVLHTGISSTVRLFTLYCSERWVCGSLLLINPWSIKGCGVERESKQRTNELSFNTAAAAHHRLYECGTCSVPSKQDVSLEIRATSGLMGDSFLRKRFTERGAGGHPYTQLHFGGFSLSITLSDRDWMKQKGRSQRLTARYEMGSKTTCELGEGSEKRNCASHTIAFIVLNICENAYIQ